MYGDRGIKFDGPEEGVRFVDSEGGSRKDYSRSVWIGSMTAVEIYRRRSAGISMSAILGGERQNRQILMNWMTVKATKKNTNRCRTGRRKKEEERVQTTVDGGGDVG